MAYDKAGNPIVYKDDVDVLLLLDSLNDQGIAHEKKKQDQMAAMKAKVNGLYIKGNRTARNRGGL